MRMSRLLVKTQKQVAAEAELPSHKLLLRAGLARRISAGIYSLAPLAYRVIRKIEQIAREEMDRIDGQEILLPVAQPASLWRESGRYDAIDASLARWQDRTGQEMVLAITHAEAVTDLARVMNCAASDTRRCVFYTADGTSVIPACIRGDLLLVAGKDEEVVPAADQLYRAGGAEIRVRRTGETRVVPLPDVWATAASLAG